MNLMSVIENAVVSITEKNKEYARKNRIKNVIKHENCKLNKFYAEIGKYYYLNMRGLAGDNIEDICQQIDCSKDKVLMATELLRKADNQECKSDESQEKVEEIHLLINKNNKIDKNDIDDEDEEMQQTTLYSNFAVEEQHNV